MNAFKTLTAIPPDFQFALETPAYKDGAPIKQVMVIGYSDLCLTVAPLKRFNQPVPQQKVIINPLYAETLCKKGTVVFFEDGKAIKFHTAAVRAPDLLSTNFM